jgi:hypothetical protein
VSNVVVVVAIVVFVTNLLAVKLTLKLLDVADAGVNNFKLEKKN